MKDMEHLYQENADAVYRFLLSLGADEELAEELTAETLFRGVKRIAAFRAECRLSTWLCTIAKHLYFDEIKRRGRHFSLEEAVNKAEENLEQETADRDEAARIRTALAELPEPYADVFSLRVLGGVPLHEIASLYGKSESWARVTFYRAKCMIQERLKGESL